jgi:hypothetical protein
MEEEMCDFLTLFLGCVLWAHLPGAPFSSCAISAGTCHELLSPTLLDVTWPSLPSLEWHPGPARSPALRPLGIARYSLLASLALESPEVACHSLCPVPERIHYISVSDDVCLTRLYLNCLPPHVGGRVRTQQTCLC